MIRNSPRIEALAALLLLVTEAALTAQNTKAKHETSRTASAVEYRQLAQYREATGSIVSATADRIVLRIDLPQLERNASTTARRSRSRANPSVHVDLLHLDFDLPVAPKAAIMKSFQSIEYDERGNVKSSSSASATGPGTSQPVGGKPDDLAVGTIVNVRLEAPSRFASSKTGETVNDRPLIKSMIALRPAGPATTGAKRP